MMPIKLCIYNVIFLYAAGYNVFSLGTPLCFSAFSQPSLWTPLRTQKKCGVLRLTSTWISSFHLRILHSIKNIFVTKSLTLLSKLVSNNISELKYYKVAFIIAKTKPYKRRALEGEH